MALVYVLVFNIEAFVDKKLFCQVCCTIMICWTFLFSFKTGLWPWIECLSVYGICFDAKSCLYLANPHKNTM